MQLRLVRDTFTSNSTIGNLEVEGRFACFTLEDVVRPVKIAGMTAIRAASYEVVVTFSERFQRPMPLLLKVPDFDGIRIHWGNTDKDTDGCILVGRTKGEDVVGESRAAFATLFGKIDAAAKVEKIFIEIIEQRGDSGADLVTGAGSGLSRAARNTKGRGRDGRV
jgi:hypothetical protein